MEPIVEPVARGASPGSALSAPDVISIQRLSLTYGHGSSRVVALRDISFRMGDGELVVVVGPSGCGKSTLLKIIAGLLRPTEGSVALKGQRVSGPRRDIGVVFQTPVLFPWRTVLGNVLLPADVQGLDRKAMSMADLKGKRIGVTSMASAGVIVARALAKQAGLDPDKDISIVVAGESAQTAALLRSKQVDALSQFAYKVK